MKKIISILLALAFVLALCTIPSFAAKTNIALEKDVETWDAGGANDNFNMPDWFQKENLVDGRLDAFDGNTSNLAQSLAWYTAGNTRDVDITATVDLDGTFNIGEVKLFPTKFLDGYPTPSTFTVEISEDGSEWTEIGGETELPYNTYTEPFIYDGQGKAASYIRVHIFKESEVFDSNYFGGFGELEVYEAESAPVTGSKRSFDAAAGDGLSYDQILVNGTEVANGNDAVIATKTGINGEDGSIQTISLHGWYGNANHETVAIGYSINGGAITYGDYFVETGTDVTGLNPNNRRFTVTVDVSGLYDENEIWIYAKLTNGDEVKLDRSEPNKDREVYVIYNGPTAPAPVNPPAADASLVIFILAAVALSLVVLKKKVF